MTIVEFKASCLGVNYQKAIFQSKLWSCLIQHKRNKSCMSSLWDKLLWDKRGGQLHRWLTTVGPFSQFLPHTFSTHGQYQCTIAQSVKIAATCEQCNIFEFKVKVGVYNIFSSLDWLKLRGWFKVISLDNGMKLSSENRIIRHMASEKPLVKESFWRWQTTVL